MGIPYYFSYLIKNHNLIISKLQFLNNNIHNLFLDCNSLIYDSLDFKKFQSKDQFESYIIENVIIKIEEIIRAINPSNIVYIAFDGVPPFAKISQQKNRRYKSAYQSNLFKTDTLWDSCAITPGTRFMADLNNAISLHFKNVKYNAVKPLNVILSLSNEPGEGEHKLFEYIRSYPELHNNTNTVIYGLDADLIMLSINHLPITNNIYLFRETPHFIKSINTELEPNETYLLDIPELSRIITLDMNNNQVLSTEQQKNRIYDYIFLCFFLGNDFMPHFPSVNIRTGGVDKMLNAYKCTIGGTNENLTDGKKIYWKNVRKLVQFLADNEEEFIKMETKLRDRREKNHIPDITVEDKIRKFDAIPVYERSLEKYINPYKKNWQTRYYNSLFNIEIDDKRRQQICVNYLEGLEWTMKYYTTGCPDWRWTYNYNYPPLFIDLIHYIPFFDTEFVENKGENPVSDLVQLCYVLPKKSLPMLPSKLYINLLKHHSNWYNNDCYFVWAYCKYFWESHVNLPYININELEKFVEEHK